MKRAAITLGVMVVLFMQFSATAAVTPVLIKLDGDGTNYLATYTVPSGKILAIDAIQFNTSVGIELVSTNGDVLTMDRKLMTGDGYSSLSFSGGLYSLNRSVKIPSGTVLRTSFYNGRANSACVYGSLIDADDLYARAVPSIQDVEPMFGVGAIALAVNAGNDAIVRVERSSDVAIGQWDTVSTFATGSGGERTMVLADDDAFQGFYRLRTLSR